MEMLARRIIPCLDCDYREGRTVVLKGKQFEGLRYVGEPLELAERYSDADELVMLDIGATINGRQTFLDTLEQVASVCSIPLCSGGGIRTFADFEARIKKGADQCAINTAALNDPSLLSRAAAEFGSQAVVVSVDAKQVEGEWWCFSSAGKVKTSWRLEDWLQRAEQEGAGEVLLTSIGSDGMEQGYDMALMQIAERACQLPLIASGGCQIVEDMAQLFEQTSCSGALAASIFHFGKETILDVREKLRARGIEVRK
jgi:cyclase